VQRFHCVIHNFVVHGAAVQRVRMANQRGMRAISFAFMEQRFQPARGPIQKQRSNRHSFVVTLFFNSDTTVPSISFRHNNVYSVAMDPVRLTRQLVDIESITGNEAAVGAALYDELYKLGYTVHKVPVAHGRFNVQATIEGQRPDVVFSTHMDTVPPFIPSSENNENIYGRGACDAKGIIAAQIAACQRLRKESVGVGMLFVVGEERDSMGAKTANDNPLGSRFLINGEPTENKIAVASKGALRMEIVARGKMAHSAYPELGESAIDKLLDALCRLRQMELPENPEVGRCTLNIGIVEGGRAPNVIPDYARAHLLYRLVGPSEQLRQEIAEAVAGLAEAEVVLEIPFAKLRTVAGIDTMVAAFTTDIPFLKNWGEPVLLGPGSIHVAHTEREYISKRQLHESVDLYCDVARKLLKSNL
jgi:acetylornithine deacetylase